MTRRKPRTTNANIFKGIELRTRQFPLVSKNLVQVHDVLTDAVEEFSRITAIRLDLRYPDSYDGDEVSNAITSFFRSLNSQIKEELKRRKRRKSSVSRERLRFIWCKEIYSSPYPHFHIVIILNKDNFRCLGNYNDFSFLESVDKCKTLYQMAVCAWARALNIDLDAAYGAVHVPENPIYYVIERHPFDDYDDEDYEGGSFDKMFNELFNRAVYLTKLRTRAFGRGRTFGTSRRTQKEIDNQFFRELLQESLLPRF
ncbi:inovirus Gp2 family protein [Vibrio diabolicus]|uniref:inovirus Gp2 family protein n=1 Tax=Vibrio diabolicus TaxID=50719 RepID=UPI00215FF23F|nr:inovirus Gp2 family protein [Vibrio diabolicus]EIE9609362.1 inovirus Gp2 family protein [Vibrio parahaemolyticus]EJE4707500.1 inovirus Gp2 family protein [Vibrio parahaemolyticus]MCS0317312.1 inovirus Gp2 family protein [Vibrio diabolicus]